MNNSRLVFLSFLILALLGFIAGCSSGGGGGGGGPSNAGPVITASPTSSPAAFIEGYVYASKAKQTGPVAGATVRIQGLELTATTDENGYFRIEGVPPGQYNVHVIYSGCNLIQRLCRVVSGSNRLEDLNTVENHAPQIAYFEPDIPDEGGPVKVYGVNFGNNSQVKINALPVDPQDYWSRKDDEIICLVPDGSISGYISVIAGGNTASKPVTVAPQKDLVISSHYVSATDSDVPVTVRLKKPLNDISGFAFFLKFNPRKMTVNPSFGKDGAEKASSLSSGLLAAKSRSSTAPDAGYLDVGFTLKGNTVSGSRDLVIAHFKPNSSLNPGTFCKIEIDTSRKPPQACIKAGGSVSYPGLSWTAGYLVVKR
jgi:hypothetical protein